MVEQNYFTESLFKFQVKWTKAIFEKEQKWSATATNKGSGKPNNNSEAAECTVLGFWDHLCPWKLLVIYRILRSLTNNPKSREKKIKWLFFIFSFFWVRKKWMKQKVKKKKKRNVSDRKEVSRDTNWIRKHRETSRVRGLLHPPTR